MGRFFKWASIGLGVLSGPLWAQQDIVQQQRPQVAVNPEPLDWRKIKLPELSYTRMPVEGGSEIITVPFSSEKMFHLQLLFPGGVYSTPRELRPTLQATVDLMVSGGFGAVNSTQVEKVLMDRGLSISTSLTATGRFTVAVQGMAKDASEALDLVTQILLKPRFDPEALDVWKKNNGASFESFLMAGQMRQQMRFLEQQIVTHLFGDGHYYASMLKRMAPKATQTVALDTVKKLGSELVTRTGTSLVLAGQFSKVIELRARKLLEQLPRKEATLIQWLPEGPLPTSIGKPKVVFLQKTDMNQSQVVMRVHFPKTRELSPLDEAKLILAMEAFSSSVGVVGSDRFSKAIRADSGLSYMANADCDDSYLKPAWALLTCSMVFQSPNNRVAEALQVAHRTWNEFLQFGITQDEFTRARAVRINRLLGLELTPFQRLSDVFTALEEGRTIPTISFERALLRWESQKDHKAVNQLLTELHRDPQAVVVGIMGPGDKKTLDAIQGLPWVGALHKVEFNSIVNSLK